jgi:hypothetical protein
MAIYTGKSYYDPEQDAIVQGTSGSNPNKNFNYLNFYSAPQTVNPVVSEPTATLTPTPTKKKPVAPGRAWVWDEASGNWKQPEMPTDGNYKWYDNQGWVKISSSTGAPSGSSSGTTTGGGTVTEKKPVVYTSSDGKTFTDQQAYAAYQSYLDSKKATLKSAYDSLRTDFKTLGLESLVGPLEDMIQRGVTGGAELINELRATPEYKDRFAANEARIKNGYRALSEGEYIQKENAYRKVMQIYGIPQGYYSSGKLGKTPAFEKLLAGDVSSDELESRVQEGLNKVINGSPEVMASLKAFYPEINTGDILGYVLDPTNALQDIKRKVTSAQIGGAALGANLLGMTPEEIAKNLPEFAARAKELANLGITGEQYGAQSPFLASATQRGGQLASIYNQDQYGRTQAEAEAFNLAGGTAAAAQRRKLTELEKSSFGGRSGLAQNALNRDRAITGYMLGTPGAGSI